MDEPDSNPAPQISEYWHLLGRRRWWILGTFFLCWALAWMVSWVLPAQYRSETLILVEQQKVPQEYVVSNVATDLQDQLQTMTEQILSRTRLQRIVDDFRLYPEHRTRLSNDQLVEQMRKDIQIEAVESPGKQELNAFRIYYTARDPVLAQRVASELTSLFIEENLQERQQQSESTTEFLASELEQAHQSLVEQEAKVKDFKTRYLGELPSQMQSNIEILNGLQNRYESLTANLNHSRQQKLYLESLLNQYRAVGITSGSGAPPAAAAPSVDEELRLLHSELDEARARYTETHPDVVRLKSQIAKAEKRKQQIEASTQNPQTPGADDGKGGGVAPADLQSVSPILQLESQLKATEQEIKDTQSQLTATEEQIRDYQSRLNVSPIREQKLADLTRDYDQSKANYESLLKKQMQSQLATNLEKRQQGQQFSILDPPSLPRKAAFPNRMKFSLVGMAAGLLLGIVLAIGFEKIGDRVRTEGDLRTIRVPKGIDIVSTSVLAGIPYIATPAEERWRRWRYAGECLAAMALLAVMAVGNALSFYRG
jgi:polysaccharide chain length determinant protein (PEP-CTERM system associated)